MASDEGSDPVVESVPDDGDVKPLTAFEQYVIGHLEEGARNDRRLLEIVEGDVMPRLDRLDRKVFGSMPPPLLIYPPGKGPSLPSLPPLTKRMATSETGLENLAQEVSNIRSELGKQSKVMGLPKPDDESTFAKFRAYVFSRTGMKELGALALAIATLVSVLRGQAMPAPAPSASHATGAP